MRSFWLEILCGAALNHAASRYEITGAAAIGWLVRWLPADGESSISRLWLRSSSDRPCSSSVAHHSRRGPAHCITWLFTPGVNKVGYKAEKTGMPRKERIMVW